MSECVLPMFSSSTLPINYIFLNILRSMIFHILSVCTVTKIVIEVGELA